MSQIEQIEKEIKKVERDLGIYLFFLGLILSLILGYFASKTLTNENEIKKFLVLNILVILTGFLVGIFNIDKKKLNNFLISATAFLVAIIMFNMFLNNILAYSIMLGNEKLRVSTLFLTNLINSIALFISSSLIFPSLKRVLKLLE